MVSAQFAAVFDDEIKHRASSVGPCAEMERHTVARWIDELVGFWHSWGRSFGACVDHVRAFTSSDSIRQIEMIIVWTENDIV